MKRFVLLVFAIVFGFSSCEKEDTLTNDIIGEWALTRDEEYEKKDGRTKLTFSQDISDPYESSSNGWEYLKVNETQMEGLFYSINDKGEKALISHYYTYFMSGSNIRFYDYAGYAPTDYTIEKLTKNEMILNFSWSEGPITHILKTYYKRVK